MASAAGRFSRLEKIAIFLIVMGEERSREILADMDLQTIEQINRAIGHLGAIKAQEKASVMIEFGDFFYKNKPLASKLKEEKPTKVKAKPKPKKARSQKPKKKAKAVGNTGSQAAAKALSVGQKSAEEKTASATLKTLKEQADAGKINWGKAGYDFGDGFKGMGDRRR